MRPRDLDLKINGYVIGQFPNVPILIALAAASAGLLLESGSTAADVARSIFFVALTVWAYEEAVRGVNLFRKALGVVTLIFVVVRIAQELGGI